MNSTRWARWWPVTGIVFVALWLIGLALVSSVDTHDTDAEIVSHYAKSSNRHQDIAAFFLVLAALLFFVWFLTALRDRLAAAEGRPGKAAAAAFGAGLVTTALWLIAVATFVSPSAAVSDTSKFHLDPDTYRILQDLGYIIWFSGTTIAAITVVATAHLSLKTGFLPKWLAWLSFAVAVTLLVSFFFFPFLIFLGWVLVSAITLIVRPWPRPTPTTPVT